MQESVLKKSIRRIKKYLIDEKDSSVKFGLYMALHILQSEIIVEEESALKEYDLSEDLEKYL